MCKRSFLLCVTELAVAYTYNVDYVQEREDFTLASNGTCGYTV